MADPFIAAALPSAGALLTTTALVAGAALASFTLPGLWNLFSGNASVTKRSLLIERIDADGTILHSNGRRTIVLEITGADTSQRGTEAETAAENNLTDWVTRLGTVDVDVRDMTRTRKSKAPQTYAFGGQLAEWSQRRLNGLEPFLDVQHYLAFTSRRAGRDGEQDLEDAYLNAAAKLQAYGIRKVSNESGDIARLLSWPLSPVQPSEAVGTIVNPRAILQTDDAVPLPGGKGIGFPDPITGTMKIAACWTIRRIEGATRSDFARQLAQLPYDAMSVHAFKVHDAAKSTAILLSRQKYANRDGKSAALNERIASEKDRITGGESHARQAHYFFVYFAVFDDEAALKAADQVIRSTASTYNFSVKREGAFLNLAYEALIPGQRMPWDQLGQPAFNYGSDNIAATLSFMAAPTGAARSQWSPGPVDWVKTWLGSLYRMTYHVTDQSNDPIGHGAIVGETSSGKTGYALWMAAHAITNPHLRVFWFDCFSAAYPFAKFLERDGRGKVLSVTDPSLAFNPAQLPDTPGNRAHLAELLRMILRTDFSRDLPSAVEAAVTLAVEINYHPGTPKALRRLPTLVEAAFPAPAGHRKTQDDLDLVRARTTLLAWLKPGGEAEFLCAANDNVLLDDLTGGAQFICIDFQPMRQANNRAASLFVFEMAYRIEQTMQETRPCLLVMDEAADFMKLEGASDWLNRLLSIARRMNTGVWTIWQRPAQILELHGLLDVMQTAAATKWIFPNSEYNRVAWEKFLERPSDTLLDHITKTSDATRLLARPMIVLRPDHHVVVETDLSKAGPEVLTLLRGTKTADTLRKYEAEMPLEAAFAKLFREAA